MVKVSRVKCRKYTRVILLKRKNGLKIPINTVRYHHKSARFTGMMSDIGIERIGHYVQVMEYHANILAEMTKTGIIDERVIAEMAELIRKESEQTEPDLTLINNSLVRFLHADAEMIKGSAEPTEPGGNPCIPENAEQVENPNCSHPAVAAPAAVATGDAHE